jgi:hypothetical protein
LYRYSEERAARDAAAAAAEAKATETRESIALDKAELAEASSKAEEAQAIAHLAGIARTAILSHVEAEAGELRKEVGLSLTHGC